MTLPKTGSGNDLVYNLNMAETKEKPKCPSCGSGEVYYRRILKEFACRRCGVTWKDGVKK